ncbi:hypothetical protein ACFQHO_29410 [Actinomadura yumaensis]|uniref:hypothetical protein n=1 Tax=Actinomadura yumaensis TaxID=111807 RepID=UPI003618267F
MTAQTPVPATPEISLVEAVWRYRLMSLIIVLACLLASVAATQIMFSGATATARFAVTDPTNHNNVLRQGVTSAQGFGTYTAQRAAFAGSAQVMARAAEIVKSKRGPRLTGEQLRGRVKTSTKPDGGVVIVSATGGSMAEAAVTANAVVQAYQDVTISTNVGALDGQIKNIQNLERKVTGDLEVAQAGTRSYKLLATQLAKLQSEESGLLSARAKVNDGVQFVDTADPSASAGSKLPQNAVIGLAVGLIIACVVSFLRASARPRPRPARGYDAAGGPPLGGGQMNGGLPGGAMPELPAGRQAAGEAPRPPDAGPPPLGGRHADDAGRAPRQAPPLTGSRGGGRRARGRSAPPPDPAADRSGRVWTSEEVHGLAATATPPASATTAVPAMPPDKDQHDLNGLNGSRGRPPGVNGSTPAHGKQAPGAPGAPGQGAARGAVPPGSRVTTNGPPVRSLRSTRSPRAASAAIRPVRQRTRSARAARAARAQRAARSARTRRTPRRLPSPRRSTRPRPPRSPPTERPSPARGTVREKATRP